MRLSFVVVMSLFLLTGCFLKQNPPGPMDGTLTPAYLGIISLDDRSGWQSPQASFMAGFWKKEEKVTKPSRSLRLKAYSQKTNRAEPECEYQTQIVQEDSQTENSLRTDFLSVGMLSFGPALQSSFESVAPNTTNAYQKKIRPGLPAGLFQVIASGTASIKKFADYLSMPEAIQEATINGVVMSEGLPLPQKSSLQFKWRRPAIENEANYILIDFLAKDGTTLHKISCSAEEGDLLAQEEFAHWTLPQTMVDQLPVTSAAAAYLMRAHVRNVANSQLTLQLQGYRTVATPAVIFAP